VDEWRPNQVSFVLLDFVLFAFSGLSLVFVAFFPSVVTLILLVESFDL